MSRTRVLASTLGVLGCGSIGLRHVRNAVGMGLEVLAHDSRGERLELALEAGAGAAGSGEELLERCGRVLIATPSGRHGDDLQAALAHACHVLVEKPFVTSVDAALVDGLRTADADGRVVAAAMNMRFHACVMAAREAIAKHDLGPALWARFTAASYLPDWRPGQDYRAGYAASAEEGGAIFDFTHEIDLACHLLGEAVLVASHPVRSGMLDIAGEDMADMLLEHAGGCRTTIHVDYLTRPRRRGFEIAFERGFLGADLEQRTLAVRDTGGDTLERLASQQEHNETYVAMLGGFVAVTGGGRGAFCPAGEALSVSRLAVAARSAPAASGTCSAA